LQFCVDEAGVRITLAELELHRIIASETYAPGVLDYRDAAFRQTAPLPINATAELYGTEIRIRGHLTTKLAGSCDRCLGPVEIPVDTEFDLMYRPMQTIAREEDIEIPVDELEVGFYSGDGIELAEVATEQVILSLPMKVICQPDCRGLCPTCRANLNVAQCACTVKVPKDSPFASLK
jgi:uncharacterized protein